MRSSRADGYGGLASGLALSLVTFALLFLAGEWIARALWEKPASPPAPEPQVPVLRGVIELATPHARGIYYGVPHRTNSQGLRGPELPRKAPPGEFRIAVTGDSITMGAGVLEQDSYPMQLERELNAADAGRRYRVLNVGLAGIPIANAIDRLERAAHIYAPDLLVYGFTLNDIEGPAYRRLAPPAARAALVRSYSRFKDSRSYLLRMLWPRVIALRERISPTIRYDEELEHNFFENQEAWSGFATHLERFAELARERGVCAAVLLHTQLADLDSGHRWRPIYERVSRAARQLDLPVIDPFPSFAGRDPSQLKLAPWDSHPNPAGHALLAQALLEGLRALPDACWEPGA